MKFKIKVINVPIKGEWSIGISFERQHDARSNAFEIYIAISLFNKIIFIGYLL